MSLEEEFAQLWRTTRVGFMAPERAELAFAAFPARLKPAIPTTAEELAERRARYEADVQGQRVQEYTVERLLVGEPPHQGHALRFIFADGTTQYFAPHKT